MDKNGKLCDVIINDRIGRDPSTGLPIDMGATVYADKGMLEVINTVPGVLSAYNLHSDTEYTVHFDPRYDREFVKREIEAQIKIHG